MRILFLSRWFPYPANNGSRLRILHLLKGLSERHTLALVSFYEPEEGIPDLDALDAFCASVRVVARKPFRPHSRGAVMGFFSPLPRSVVDTFSPEMVNTIQSVIDAHKPDLVIASQVDMAAYGKYLRGLPAIFEEAELAVLYERVSQVRSLPQRIRHGLTWVKHRRYLKTLLRDYTACTVVSQPELELLTRAVPDAPPVEIIPNFIDLREYEHNASNPNPANIIFTGSLTYSANYIAVCWFIQEVYPLIRSNRPDIRLILTGDPGDQALPVAENVIQTGMVEDVKQYLGQAWVSIVPILTGGGTRLKILEAMAVGTPVVATSKGAQGLAVQHGEHLLIADTASEFAQAVIRLLDDPGLRVQLVHNAFRLIQEQYASQSVMPRFLELVERTVKHQVVNPVPLSKTTVTNP